MIQPYIAVYKARCPKPDGTPSIFLNVVVKDTHRAPKSKQPTLDPNFLRQWRKATCVGFFCDN